MRRRSRSTHRIGRRIAGVITVGLAVSVPLSGAVGAPRQAAEDSASNPLRPVTVSKTVSRINVLPDGAQDVAERRKVTVSVSQTAGLRTLQQITVSWKGAHPTNYIDPDPNSGEAATLQEYPMVLMECRGVDSTSVPVAQRLSPQTCWTQYNVERNASAPGTRFPAWRLDRYAGNLPAFNHVPNPLPVGCSKSFLGEADYFEPLKGANGTSYYSGPIATCSKLAPEQSNVSASFPDNTTFGVSAADGSGLSKFVIWSAETNETLGCSSTVKCALVAIPIVGISCDEQARAGVTAADIANCTYSDKQSGEVENGPSELGGNPGQRALDAVDGALWWSASNWRNRIVIPLSFAPPANYCSVVTSRPSVFIYGSELMNEATEQWSPAFCTDPHRTPFTSIAQAEPAAVNELKERSIEASFETYAPTSGSGPPIVNAPVAVTGFAISTVVDDAQGNEDLHVVLDARLLAKLLTESYPVLDEVANNDGMAGNPLNITLDPEFRALNPDIPEETAGSGRQIYPEARATLMALSSDSDVMHALTAYIEADPAARAFINGQPDPWGMVVNPAYKGMNLPTDFWPLKDNYIPLNSYNSDQTSCFAQPRYQVPYLPLVAAPLLTLSSVAFNLEFAQPNSTTACTIGAVPAADKITADPRQTPGSRFLLGITSLAQAKRYDLDTASLETQSSVAPGTKFTTAAGSTFVAPTDASLRAAAAELKPSAADGAWTLDYDKLRSDPTAKDAYPGTMLVSMSVPTADLAAPDARAYSELMDFAAGSGQTPGTNFGQLAPGYLPMTEANGLGRLSAYTARAATAVADQQCEVPDLTGSGETRSKWSGCPSPSSPTPSPSDTTPAPTHSSAPGTTSTTPSTQESVPSDGSQGASAVPSVSPVASPRPGGGQSPSVAASPSDTPIVVAEVTPASPTGSIGLLLPLLLLAGIVAAAAAVAPHVVVWFRGGPGPGAKT